MGWKTFLQVALLLIIAGIVFYIVCPKYRFTMSGERGNIFTGKLQRLEYDRDAGYNWVDLE